MRHWLVVGAAVGATILVVFLLDTANAPAVAQPPTQNAEVAPPPPPALEAEPEETEEEEDDDIVRIEHFDELEYDATQELYYLSGNVIFSHQDVKFYCDEVWYYKADDTARTTGHLRVVDPEATITGDLAFADFDAEVTTITGNVVMIAQKKKKGSAAEGEEEKPTKFEEYQQKKTTITCPKLVYEYADDVKRATFFPPIKAVQEDKTAWADSAVYEDLKDIVTLTGNVRVKTEKGEEFRFAEVIISIEEEWMKGKDGSGLTFRRRKKEEAD